MCSLCIVGTGAPNGVSQEKRTVVLQIKVGADAKDYDAVATEQALGPLEVEMKKLEETMVQLNKEMMFIRAREAAMRDTNGMIASTHTQDTTNTQTLKQSCLPTQSYCKICQYARACVCVFGLTDWMNVFCRIDQCASFVVQRRFDDCVGCARYLAIVLLASLLPTEEVDLNALHIGVAH
jgi:hypothetical protein